MILCSIYDYKSKTYGYFQVFENTVQAMRTFESAVKNDKSIFHQYPTDFGIFLIATIDMHTGAVTSEAPSVIANAVDFA